jgi:hypothetical protein
MRRGADRGRLGCHYAREAIREAVNSTLYSKSPTGRVELGVSATGERGSYEAKRSGKRVGDGYLLRHGPNECRKRMSAMVTEQKEGQLPVVARWRSN